MTQNENKITPYIIRLVENNNSTTYRINQELFLLIKQLVKPYQSFKTIAKKVRCIETNTIFKHAKDANDWLIKIGKSKSSQGDLHIKKVCKQKGIYTYGGYHWEFIE